MSTTAPHPLPRAESAGRLAGLPLARQMQGVILAMLLPLLAIAAAYGWLKYESIAFTRQELRGLAYFHPLEEMAGHVDQRSTALTQALVTGGRPDMAAHDAAIGKLVGEMDEADARYGTPASSAMWKDIRADWETLRSRPFATAAEAMPAHAALVARMSKLRRLIATDWGTALDPEAAAYYTLDLAVVQIPDVLSQLYQLHASIVEQAGNPRHDAESRLALVNGAAQALKMLEVIETETATAREKLAGQAASLAMLDALPADWTRPVADWLLDVEHAEMEAGASAATLLRLAEGAGAAHERLDAAHDQTMTLATHLLRQRNAIEIRDALVVLALVLLGTALAVRFALAITSRLVGSVQRLRQISGHIAAGRLDNEIDTAGRDEMGALYGAVDQMQQQLRADRDERLRSEREIRRLGGGLAATSVSVMIVDESHRITYLNEAARRRFGAMQEALHRELPVELASQHRSRRVLDGRHLECVASPIVGEQGERLGMVAEWTDHTDAVRAEQEIDAVVDAVLEGDLSRRIAEEGKSGFHALCATKINAVVGGMAAVVQDVQGIVAQAGRGDLSRRVQVEGRGGLAQRLGGDVNALVDSIDVVVTEVQHLVTAANQGDLGRRIATAGRSGLLERIGGGINALTANMAQVVSQVKAAAGEVSRGADELSQGNLHLSQRTEEQASSLEETASTMEQMTSTVRQNADNAGQASQLAVAARDQAERGGAVVTRAVEAMTGINEASRRIADIIGVIDEIAFQTNLLALNAAVEAARAGEQGRGFAVVASEVRTLAGRSATAAKEIKSLIQASVQRVDEGSMLVTESGAMLEQIVQSVKKVSDIVAEIAAASTEQSAGIEQVNKVVMQLDELTQQNASLVEQASAASQTMAEQARGLNESMQRYRVEAGHPGGRAARAIAA